METNLCDTARPFGSERKFRFFALQRVHELTWIEWSITCAAVPTNIGDEPMFDPSIVGHDMKTDAQVQKDVEAELN